MNKSTTILFFVLLSFTSCKKESFELNSYEEYIHNISHSSDYIYDQDYLHRFDIYISQENLDKLNNDPTAEEYVEGSLVFEGNLYQ